MLHRFEVHSALERSRTALLCCRIVASRLREAARWQLATFHTVRQTNNKQLLDEVFVISGIIKVEVSGCARNLQIIH